MTTPEQTGATAAQAQDAEQVNKRRFIPKAAIAMVAAAAIGGASYLVLEQTGGGSEATAAANYPTTPGTVTSEKQAKDNCDDIESANAASNSALYGPQAFLPDYRVQDSEQAKQYVFDLFSDKGPLAGKADYSSLAAMMSLVVIASHQGGTVNTNYNFVTEFNTEKGRLTGPNKAADNKNAIEDCKEALTTLVQDLGYNGDWANQGDVVTEFAAIRDKDYNITDAKPYTSTVTKGTKLQGVEFTYRDDSKGQNGYASVLISTNSKGVWNGNLYIKGVRPEQVQGVSTKNNGQKPLHVKKNTKPVPHGTATNLGNTNTVTSNTGTSESHTGAASGVSGSATHNTVPTPASTPTPENQGTSNTPSPSQGGTTPESIPATQTGSNGHSPKGNGLAPTPGVGKTPGGGGSKSPVEKAPTPSPAPTPAPSPKPAPTPAPSPKPAPTTTTPETPPTTTTPTHTTPETPPTTPTPTSTTPETPPTTTTPTTTTPETPPTTTTPTTTTPTTTTPTKGTGNGQPGA